LDSIGDDGWMAAYRISTRGIIWENGWSLLRVKEDRS
jgi:hypothetical protein